MLFHLGTLWRLNDAAYLGKLDRISSVSGGSITAGVLGLHWKDLGVNPNAPAPRFSMVVDEVRKLAARTIDIGSVLEGPGVHFEQGNSLAWGGGALAGPAAGPRTTPGPRSPGLRLPQT